MAVKVYHAGQPSSPSLRGQVGSLIALLDAVLVNGYGAVSVSSLTRSGSTATVVTSAAHGFSTGDVALISGAAQSDYNIEAVVSVVDATSFSYSVQNSPVTPATGTVSVKRAPAGFTKEYSGTNQAVYRSLSTLGTRPYLQVLDDGVTSGAAKEARVRGYLTMSDITTGSEPFPTTTQSANGLFCYKSGTIDSTNRPWVLITNGRTIYFQASMDQSPTSLQASGGNLWWMAFGDLLSTRASDPYSAFLCACTTANNQTAGGTNSNGLFDSSNRTMNPSSPSSFVVRSYTQSLGAAVMGPVGHGWDQQAIGSLQILPYPHIPDNGFIMTPLMMAQGGVLRGRVPGVYESMHGCALNQFDIIENVDGFVGRKFMALWGCNRTGSFTTGMLMFDITGDSNGDWG